MIVPITFQGVANFSASRYALEVRSRFIDQNNAHGFYAGYGEELDAVIIGNTIKIKSGAFLICGRQFELVNDETVTVTIENGKVGYIVARVESFHPEDEHNICRFSAKNGTSLGGIALMQENLYSITADEQNTVFELPIFSFAMSSGQITNLKKLLSPIADYYKAYDIAEQAKGIANTADGKADTAISDSSQALSKANTAIADSAEALGKANTAISDSAEAVQTSQQAVAEIISGHGTRIKKNNVQLTDWAIDNVMETDTHLDTSVPATPTDSKAYSSKLAKAELAKKADTSSLKLVATSGNYNDLSNKPTIPAAVTIVNDFTSTSTTSALSANMGKVINDKLIAENLQLGKSSKASGTYSTALGRLANASGFSSTALGSSSKASGSYSTALGIQAIASGDSSTALGGEANASGFISTALGKEAAVFGEYSTALGYNATVSQDESKTIQLGSNFDLSALKCKVQLSAVSDERDKADIATIPNSLDFIDKLTPITYKSNQRIAYLSEEQKKSENYRKYGMADYDKQEHAQGTKKGERQRVGLKAQEVQQALAEVYGTADYANLVDDNFYDLVEKPQDVENQLTVAYSNIIPFLVGAIKELKAEIASLKGE